VQGQQGRRCVAWQASGERAVPHTAVPCTCQLSSYRDLPILPTSRDPSYQPGIAGGLPLWCHRRPRACPARPLQARQHRPLPGQRSDLRVSSCPSAVRQLPVSCQPAARQLPASCAPACSSTHAGGEGGRDARGWCASHCAWRTAPSPSPATLSGRLPLIALQDQDLPCQLPAWRRLPGRHLLLRPHVHGDGLHRETHRERQLCQVSSHPANACRHPCCLPCVQSLRLLQSAFMTAACVAPCAGTCPRPQAPWWMTARRWQLPATFSSRPR